MSRVCMAGEFFKPACPLPPVGPRPGQSGIGEKFHYCAIHGGRRPPVGKESEDE